jgi:hypothetical protein
MRLSKPASILFLVCSNIAAQEMVLRDIHVEKKPGHQSGPVMATVNGKPRRILPEAAQVWAVMGGKNALVLIPPSKKPAQTEGYQIRFHDASVNRGRFLGTVPFAQAEFSELKLPDGTWVFLLSGRDPHSNEPLLVIADMYAIRSRLTGAKARTPDEQSLSSLLAPDMIAIFETTTPAQHVQFLNDGSAIVIEQDKPPVKGRWWTVGDLMSAKLDSGGQLSWPRASLTRVVGIPAGSRLPVRLLRPLSSVTAKEAMPIDAVLIAPAIVDSKVLIPPGSVLKGKVTKAQSVGMAVVREKAALTLEFDKLELPNGNTRTVHCRLNQVENSREKVDAAGTIRGIRSTGTPGYGATSRLSSATAIDPLAYLFTSISSTAVLGFTEPEILYPSGAELIIELTAPLITSEVFPSNIPKVARTPEEQEQMLRFVRALPFRTATQAGNKPSDFTNLLFLGAPEAVQRALKSAGWLNVDQLTAASTFQTLKSIAGDEGYNEAPMSTLLLDERPPVFTLSKTTNTFSARHHLRVFDPSMQYQGLTALTSSSTQDIGIAFSRKQKTFIHVIDEYIDNERSKVVNDLSFTGCVDAVELVPRSWVPQNAYNATGDKLRTDGAIAVLRMNECRNPKMIPAEYPKAPPLFQRSIRNTMLTLRNNVWRGNLAYQGVSGVRKLHGLLATDTDLKTDQGDWQRADISGAEYEGFGTIPEGHETPAEFKTTDAAQTDPAVRAPDHRWDSPRYEIALQFGYLHYPTKQFEGVVVSLTSPNTELPPYAIGLSDHINDGRSAGLSVTMNTSRWLSSEFGYHIQRGKYRLEQFDIAGDIDKDLVYETYAVGLATRQFEYNLLMHARPRESRWRPYIAVGPALQLIHLTDAPVKRAPRVFRLGLQNIGLLKAAFDFGRTPPLDGGGIFQVGVQYGAGVKFRMHPRITMRLDFRETWSKNPEFIRESYVDETAAGFAPSYDYEVARDRPSGKFRQQRFTLGVAFTF